MKNENEDPSTSIPGGGIKKPRPKPTPPTDED